MKIDANRYSSRNFVSIVIRGLPIILGVTVLFGLGGLAYSLIQKPLYEATTTLYITSGTSVVPSAYDAVKASEERIQSYSQLIYSDAVLGPAVKAAGLNMNAADAKSVIRIEENPQIVLLTLGVRDHNPEVAQRLANAIADSVVDAVPRLEVPGFGGESTSKVTVVTTATVNSSPVAPETSIIIALAALVGLIIGLLIVLTRERFNNKVRDENDAVAAVGAELLAAIPRQKTTDPLVADYTSEVDAVAAAFRSLRSGLLNLSPRSVLITSARPAEGKTRTAVNLAITVARAAHTVVVVDANAQNPGVRDAIGSVRKHGLIHAVSGAEPLANLLEPSVCGVTGLSALSAEASSETNPDDLVSSSGFRNVIEELAQSFDFVVIDSPAVLDGPTARDIVPSTDGVVVVAQRGQTKLSDLHACAAQLRSADANLLGVVLFG